MSRPIQLSLRECWKERLHTPTYEYLPDGLPTDYVFSMFKPKYPPYAAVPMESGKTGLFKLLDIKTPRDPGDMHIARWGFIKYVDKSS